jgi:AraC-like DNA-binding protein
MSHSCPSTSSKHDTTGIVKPMKTVFEHTQTQLLVIPQSLFAMKDVKLLCRLRNSAIFHKNLEQDLTNIEFYTNNPCLIYIESGREVITNSNNETVQLDAGVAIFLPQGSNLHSDFVKQTKALKAKLVFFDEEVITDFLAKTNRKVASDEPDLYQYCILNARDVFDRYFSSINRQIDEQSYLHGKFQELLHLIAYVDTSGQFHNLLRTMRRLPPKKNLLRLLDSPEILHLNVSEMAHISGRSLSSFNRDFKAIYQLTPKQWLVEKRLNKARELIQSETMSVTDIAMLVGYSNVSQFIKAFKAKYGLTPTAMQTQPMT